MKKKFITILCIMTISIILVSCGGKPQGMSNKFYDLGIEALDIMDAYINEELKKDSCQDKLDELYQQVTTLEDENSIASNANHNDGLISTYLLIATAELNGSEDGEIYDFKKNRNEFAEALNEKTVK